MVAQQSPKWLSDLVSWQQQFLVKEWRALFISPDPEAHLSSGSLGFTSRWVPWAFYFSSFILFIGLITSTKIFTIWSGNSSCHLFSVLSFISYSLVKMISFNTGFSFMCVCWPQCVHFVLVSRFASWSTVVSKISQFCSCWSWKLACVREEGSDNYIRGVAAVLAVICLPVWPKPHLGRLCVPLSLLEVLLSPLFCAKTQCPSWFWCDGCSRPLFSLSPVRSKGWVARSVACFPDRLTGYGCSLFLTLNAT